MKHERIGLQATDRPLAHPAADETRYVNRQPLAEGGGAILETAVDTVLGREVVIKTLHPKFQNEFEMRRRFLREARVVAMIQHPATAPIYDLGENAEGAPFFTMKRIVGCDLQTIIRGLAAQDEAQKTFRSLDARLDIVVSVGQALAFAHDLGVVHRDVKPANILVGSFGEVMLMDWGVAKILGADDDARSARVSELPNAAHAPVDLTEVGRTYGTPQFMSPEQARGEKHVDGRSDVFSLGAVLFELLTLRRLFAGADRAEVLGQVANQPVPEMSGDRGVVPFELESICRRALKRPVRERYQSMRGFVADLQRFRHREPVSVVENTNLQRVRRWGRRFMAG